MQGWKWLANLHFGNNSATFTWHAKLHSWKEKLNAIIYFKFLFLRNSLCGGLYL